ncbi:MAG: transposase, partial [Microcystis aeruginosa L311-01]|nr:transposase [Microcystis aeruginosa L311-01]
KIAGKKGYPKYSKRTHSVEFKKSGWKLNRNSKRITFTDGKNIGELKLIGSRDLFYFQEWQIQRIRIVKRAEFDFFSEQNPLLSVVKVQFLAWLSLFPL